jgi:hypothetical protein
MLRVMIEHLPPGNAARRAIDGPWGDVELMLHSVDSHLRLLLNGYANVHKGKDDPQVEFPGFLPTPALTEMQEQRRAQHEAEKAAADAGDVVVYVDLMSTLTRSQHDAGDDEVDTTTT